MRGGVLMKSAMDALELWVYVHGYMGPVSKQLGSKSRIIIVILMAIIYG